MALSNSLVEVGIAITLRDQFSQNAGHITDSFRSMMSDIRTAAQAAQQQYSPQLEALQAVGNYGLEAYKEYASVGKDVYMTTAMIEGSQAEYNQLLKQAKDINLTVPLTTQDIASAQRYMAMAGMSLEQITAMTEPVAQLASLFDMAAGGKGGVADLFTNILATFRLGTDQVKTTADDLFTAVTNSNMSLSDLAQSIAYAGAEAMASGVSVQETAAAIGLLGDMGIQGSSAGTALANTFRYLRLSLSGQKEKGYQALQALGLGPEDFYDAKGNLISLHNTYKKFAEAVTAKGWGNDEIATAFFNIFGVRAERNMLPVVQQLSSGVDKMGLLLDKMRNNEGALGTTMEGYMLQPQGQIDKLVSTLNSIKISIGENLSGLLRPANIALNWILTAVNYISDRPFTKWLMKAAFLVGFNAALWMVRQMGVTFIRTFSAMGVAATNIARSGNAFNGSMQAALQAMLLMNAASKGLAPGSRLPLGMINGQPAWISKGAKGNIGLSYVAAPGANRGYVTNQTNMASILTGAAATTTAATAAAASKGAQNASKVAGAARWVTGGLTKVGGAVLKSIPVIGSVASIGLLLYDIFSSNTDAEDDNTDAVNRNTDAANAKQEAEARTRAQVLNQMTSQDIAMADRMGVLSETISLLADRVSEGSQLNLTINGQDVGRIAANQAIDATSYMLEGYHDSIYGNLKNMGY